MTRESFIKWMNIEIEYKSDTDQMVREKISRVIDLEGDR